MAVLLQRLGLSSAGHHGWWVIVAWVVILAGVATAYATAGGASSVFRHFALGAVGFWVRRTRCLFAVESVDAGTGPSPLRRWLPRAELGHPVGGDAGQEVRE